MKNYLLRYFGLLDDGSTYADQTESAREPEPPIESRPLNKELTVIAQAVIELPAILLIFRLLARAFGHF